jgi:hypothetical protein
MPILVITKSDPNCITHGIKIVNTPLTAIPNMCLHAVTIVHALLPSRLTERYSANKALRIIDLWLSGNEVSKIIASIEYGERLIDSQGVG